MKNAMVASLFLMAWIPLLAAGPALSLGAGAAEPGDTVSVEVTLNTAGERVVALTADVLYDASAMTPEGVETSVPGKVVAGHFVSPGVYRFTLYGGRGALPDGPVVTLRLRTASGGGGIAPLRFAPGTPAGSTAEATPVSLEGRPGAITFEKRIRKAVE